MPKIDPEVLKQSQETTRIIEVRNNAGDVIGYKGRFSPDTYDNFTECLKENAKEHERAELAAQGKNEHGQTKGQQTDFARRAKNAEEIKMKSNLALAAAAQAK